MRKQFICNVFFLILFILILGGMEGIAQSISGIIADKSSKQPIEFATVQLLHTGDSTVINTTVTDRKGKFMLDKIAAGNYILRLSFIGYEKAVLPVTVKQSPCNNPFSNKYFITLGTPPCACNSCIKYFPLGLKSASTGVLSLMV